MALLVLGPLLRYVGDTEASVWVEADDACEVDVLGHTARTFEVRGHHYAVVGLTGLEPGTVTDYTVKLDGAQVWPPTDEPRPRPAIHTRRGERRARLVFGSCRVGAPEREPYTRPPGEEHGFGIDALWAYSRRLQEGFEEWPDGLLLIGDQVYADEVSPATLDFIRARRDTSQPPGEEIADFEEYTRLYRESWTEPDIRWLLATVPSVMIFDDHDVIDDWNISWEWLRDARSCSWWDARITGAFMSYWLYQHIGNLTPQELAGEAMYRTAVEKDGDVGPELEAFARRADRESAASRWASMRDFGRSRVLVVDSRAARVLDDDNREMVDDEEWAWITEQSRGDVDHLLIVSTLPVFLSAGVHHLESWNEAVCSGVWGRPAAALGERLRRALDLEHWPAFHRSFVHMVDLLRDVATGGDGQRTPPASVSVIGGDIHNAYVAEVSLGRRDPARSRVHQIVCSPFRNPLSPTQRRLIKLTGTRAAGALMGGLASLAGVRMPAVRWEFRTGPTFENSVGIVELDGRRAEVTIYRAEPGDAAEALQPLHSYLLSDGPRAD
jgi:PhoD-like phosphatase